MIDLQIAKKPLRVSSIKTRIKTRDLLLSGRILSLRVSSIKTRIKTCVLNLKNAFNNITLRVSSIKTRIKTCF